MKTTLSILGLIGLTGCHIHLEPEIKTVTVTNYVSMPAEFGPDGYGHRHLSKADDELVRNASMKMEHGEWNHNPFFEDLHVIKTVTHEPMTVSEIMEALSKLPNVATVSLARNDKRTFFSLTSLAYPQYADDYKLTMAQWNSLQEFCRIQLIDPIAAPEVVAHWKSITNGVVPFHLTIVNP